MEKYKFLEGYENFGGDELIVTKAINPALQDVIKEHGNLKYIGTGNPDAEILFIGKEMAIPDNESKQHDSSVKQNVDKWNKDQYKRIPNHNGEAYSPWYPYYLQLNRPGKGGTSPTEYNYQKIISQIYDIPHEEKHLLTLHKYAFLSELSIATAAKSADVKKEERRSSIKERKILWKTSFFQGFPITILSIGPNTNYIIRDSDLEHVINIVKDFDVQFNPPTIIFKNGKEDDKRGWKFINVHFSEDGKRMLLHTSHLSISSDELVDKISQLCREFLKGRATNQGRENVQAYLNNNDNYGK